MRNLEQQSDITTSGLLNVKPNICEVHIIHLLIIGTIIADFRVRNVLCTLKGYSTNIPIVPFSSLLDQNISDVFNRI